MYRHTRDVQGAGTLRGSKDSDPERIGCCWLVSRASPPNIFRLLAKQAAAKRSTSTDDLAWAVSRLCRGCGVQRIIGYMRLTRDLIHWRLPSPRRLWQPRIRSQLQSNTPALRPFLGRLTAGIASEIHDSLCWVMSNPYNSPCEDSQLILHAAVFFEQVRHSLLERPP
jgi:hypothetical protein